MTKEKVYSILARKHRNSKAFERAWRHLDGCGKIEVPPWQTEDQVLSDIEADLVDAMCAFGKGASSEDTRAHSNKYHLVDDLGLKALALQSYFARVASGHWRVKRFRKNMLGGQILTPEDAQNLFDSPILRFLSVAQLRSRNIPLSHHSSKLLRSNIEEENEEFEHQVSLSYAVDDTESLIDLASRDFVTVPVLTPPQPNQPYRKQSCWHGSFRYELNRLIQELVQTFPWDYYAAAMFVCTGKPQPLRTIEGRVEAKFSNDVFIYSQIRLEIEPWVSSTVVKNMYLELQKKVLGKHPRRPALRNLAVFSFVNEQFLNSGKLPLWSRLHQLWNEHCREIRKCWLSQANDSDPKDTPADWAFCQESLDVRADEKKMRREYERAMQALLDGYYDKDVDNDLWEFRSDRYI